MSLLDLSLDHQNGMYKYLYLKDLHSLQQVSRELYDQTWYYCIRRLSFKIESSCLVISKYLRMPKLLFSLDLSWTQITDVGLKSLEELLNLTGLNLSGTRITDTGLKSLEGLLNLTSLHLFSTKITDTRLKSLEGLLNLTILR